MKTDNLNGRPKVVIVGGKRLVEVWHRNEASVAAWPAALGRPGGFRLSAQLISRRQTSSLWHGLIPRYRPIPSSNRFAFTPVVYSPPSSHLNESGARGGQFF
jgi:hypothetical protein